MSSFLPLCFSVPSVVKAVDISFTWQKHQNKSGNANYQRNLMGLTRVPRMGLVWVTKLFSSVPMKKPLAR